MYPWRYMETLTQTYGDLTTIWIGTSPLIIVGTYKAANEIMEKMGGVTASRPANFYASDLMSGGMRILLIPYGDHWRRLRK